MGQGMDNRVSKRLCVVIVNYRTASLVLDCIETLREQLDHDLDHIVVVDNNSGGEDVPTIKAGLGERGLSSLVTVVASPENGGFSAGNNIGVRAVMADGYLLANADTLFRDDAIGELLRVTEKYPRAGILSPRLEWPDGEPQISCFRFHSPFSELINVAATRGITRLLGGYDVPLATVADASMPEWTSFACVLIRREVFERIGYLDEGYFMYYEDVDFCRRAREAGYGIVNWPGSHVVHLRGQSSGMKKMQKERKRLPAYYYHSRARYFVKFYGLAGFLAANLCWLVGRSISLLKEILLGRDRGVPLYQFVDIWKR